MEKVGLFGVSAAFLALILKREKSEYAVAVALGAGLLIFSWSLSRIMGVMAFVERISEALPIKKDYIAALFKMLGIAYMGELGADICRDSGYSSIAAQLELFAKISIVVLSLPCLSYLMDVVEEFL